MCLNKKFYIQSITVRRVLGHFRRMNESLFPIEVCHRTVLDVLKWRVIKRFSGD